MLEKLFKAGFTDEKGIIDIRLEDLEKISEISSVDIIILLELKKAIKTKKIISFLSSTVDSKNQLDFLKGEWEWIKCWIR